MTSVSHQRDFAVEVVSKLRAAGHTALFAGGCVRDLLLGRPSKDFDVATTALPDEVRKIFGHKRTLTVGASFGVIVVVGPRHAGHVEVATFRSDGNYLDGRHPDQVTFCSPEEDARRRDFTVNGMFYDPIEEHVLDYVGGEADLRNRVIRAIGDPRDRVREDKLRMLRAVRFTATLNFHLDHATADAIRDMSSELVVVSAERITQELKRMLVDGHRRQAIELAQEVRLLRIILPELDALQRQPEWRDTLRRLELLKSPSFELAMAALLASGVATRDVNKICLRFKLSNDETDRIVWLVAHQHDLDDAPQLSLATLKRRLAHPYCEDLLRLLNADRTATSASLESVEFCRDYLARTPREILDPPPYVTGDDLIAMGFPPGPKFKSVLTSIRDAQLNLELTSREEALARVKNEWNA
jgi:poly(A) polymerase